MALETRTPVGHPNDWFEEFPVTYEETVKLGKRVFEDDGAVVSPGVPDELVKAILAARSK